MRKTIFRSGYILVFCTILAVSCTGKKTNQSTNKAPDFTFAFLTDIHVEFAKNADEGFKTAIKHVNGMDPDFVVMGGDLIADALGQTEERATSLYELYLQLRKDIKCPVYDALGNHEEFGIYPKSGIDRDHELYGDKMYEKLIRSRFYAFTEKGWRFYILDSVEETWDRQYVGGVDSVQLDWIRKDLETVDPKMPIVITTHIPLLTSFSQIRGGALAQNSRGLVVENSMEVLDAFEGHNLKLVLQGHLHILEEAYINDITFITGGAVSAKWWEGPKEGMEEGYVLLKVKGEEIDWEYVDYGWNAER